MLHSCPYEGRSQEIKWDKTVIERKRKGTKEIPTSSKRSRQQDEDKTPPHPLDILFEELSSDDDSDSSCHFDPEIKLPTLQKATGSIITRHRQKPTVETEAAVPDDHDTRSQTGGKEEDHETSEEGGEQDASDQTSDEELEAFQTWAQYYQEGKGKTEMETLLMKYCHHLQDILGGCKKPTHAVCHAQNVRRIKDATDPRGNTLKSPRWRP